MPARASRSRAACGWLATMPSSKPALAQPAQQAVDFGPQLEDVEVARHGAHALADAVDRARIAAAQRLDHVDDRRRARRPRPLPPTPRRSSPGRLECPPVRRPRRWRRRPRFPRRTPCRWGRRRRTGLRDRPSLQRLEIGGERLARQHQLKPQPFVEGSRAPVWLVRVVRMKGRDEQILEPVLSQPMFDRGDQCSSETLAMMIGIDCQPVDFRTDGAVPLEQQQAVCTARRCAPSSSP